MSKYKLQFGVSVFPLPPPWRNCLLQTGPGAHAYLCFQSTALWAHLELALAVVYTALSYRRGSTEEEGCPRLVWQEPFTPSVSASLLRQLGGGWVGALAYGFSKAILSTVGKCLDVDTCCPLHARVTLYTADTIVRTGSEPTGRHFSLKLVKH